MYCSLLTARDSSGKLKRASYLIAFNRERLIAVPHELQWIVGESTKGYGDDDDILSRSLAHSLYLAA